MFGSKDSCGNTELGLCRMEQSNVGLGGAMVIERRIVVTNRN